MAENNSQPIIIIKKKSGHGSHHGGAWKVAYADFVTAMMALFMVLWLLSSSEEVQKAVGGYFLDPAGYGNLKGSALAGTGESLSLNRDDLEKLKDKIKEAMAAMNEFPEIKNQVMLVVTGEGLRIELLENDKGMFFHSGSAQPTEAGRDLLVNLAEEIGKLPNDVVIEGHTDSKPYSGSQTYTNWELSADRANAARRIMEAGGLRNKQVKQIRGYAENNLFKKGDPENPANRRISVVIKYIDQAPKKPGKGEAAAPQGGKQPSSPKQEAKAGSHEAAGKKGPSEKGGH